MSRLCDDVCPRSGCHDPRHADVQSHDALWLGPDAAACAEHKQLVHPGGAAEAAAAAATAAQCR